MKKIVVVGSINMDYITQVKAQPGVGETVLGRGLSLKPGGKGANQAYAAAFLGGEVTMLGAIGDDEAGRRSLFSLQQAGVHTEYIKVIKGVSTGCAFIAVNEEGDNSIIVVPGANENVDCAYIDSVIEVIEKSDIVIFQLEIPLDTVIYAARKAKDLGKMVILDPAPAQRLPKRLMHGLDIIKPNQTELMQLLGKTECSCEPRHELEFLKCLGVKKPIITMGAQGSCALDENGKFIKISTIQVEAVDTTGAGDCFTGALAFSLSKGDTLADAMEFASRAAAYSVTRSGAQPSFPAPKDIKCV